MLVSLLIAVLWSACGKSDFFSNERPDLYSEREITYKVNGRIYAVPANYEFFLNWREGPRPGVVAATGLQFLLTYPEFKGVSREQAELLRHGRVYGQYADAAIGQRHFDTTIFVYEAHPLTGEEAVRAAAYRSSQANATRLVAELASRHEIWKDVIVSNDFGLHCVSPRPNPRATYCQGQTRKGELIEVECRTGFLHPYQRDDCRVERASPQEGYFAYYQFPRDLLPHWKAIDGGIFDKLSSWERSKRTK